MSVPAENNAHQAHDYMLEEEFPPVPDTGDHLDLLELNEVKLSISAELGRCVLNVREILELKRGSVLPLNKQAGEMTDLFVNGVSFGRGEVVVLGDTLHVRIAEIIGFNDKGEIAYE